MFVLKEYVCTKINKAHLNFIVQDFLFLLLGDEFNKYRRPSIILADELPYFRRPRVIRIIKIK